MCKKVNINRNWQFTKNSDLNIPASAKEWEQINLPHTWNAADGQDGGNDYYRGTCLYSKRISRSDLGNGPRYWLEFKGANASAEVLVNGHKICEHHGGYSTFRAEFTDFVGDENIIEVLVDNSVNDTVYPQRADFTFYGGLYRDVNVVSAPDTHFELDYLGGDGIKVTPTVKGNTADVEIEVYIANPCKGQRLLYRITDNSGNELFNEIFDIGKTTAVFHIQNPVLWHGRRNPYMYRAEVCIVDNEETVDCVSSAFGCRYYEIDPQRGFILNGEEYPLRGVSRHQDRLGIGNALLPEHHIEDINLICEVGANTVRLAHYQHDQQFYELCDKRGLVVWAEIPYISNHMDNGFDNTVSQFKELIIQNYNHPSIVVWGLSNEITIGKESAALIENHRKLNSIAKELDPTRLTTVAAVSMCDPDSQYLKIPDVLSYNHYFGWYGGNTSMNGPWLDKFHADYPDRPIGVSEYGCEGLNWHTSNPVQGDYTEEYQAYYHEELIKQLFTRPYIWATHVWNMFDFGADGRSEGGEAGQNHKGLVTFDRKYKKDAFYAYKAWLSDEPFVHVCGKRYVNRAEEVTKVTVYSNLPEVTLLANGRLVETKRSDNHFFYFDVPLNGETKITATAGEYEDNSVIIKVDKFDDSYRLKEVGTILNWFDITEVDGYYSLNDTLSDIIKSDDGKNVIAELMEAASDKAVFKFEDDSPMYDMMIGFTVIRLVNMMSMGGNVLSKEQLLECNRKLNLIKKI